MTVDNFKFEIGPMLQSGNINNSHSPTDLYITRSQDYFNYVLEISQSILNLNLNNNFNVILVILTLFYIY